MTYQDIAEVNPNHGQKTKPTFSKFEALELLHPTRPPEDDESLIYHPRKKVPKIYKSEQDEGVKRRLELTNQEILELAYLIDEFDPKIANKLGISSHPDDIKERQRIMTSLENKNHQTLSRSKVFESLISKLQLFISKNFRDKLYQDNPVGGDARALLSMLENITELSQLKILLQLD